MFCGNLRQSSYKDDTDFRKTKTSLFVSLPQRWWRVAFKLVQKNRVEPDALFIEFLFVVSMFVGFGD
jgi:hypothetical protein